MPMLSTPLALRHDACHAFIHARSISSVYMSPCCRGDISENVDQKQKDVFEEMGVQTDEDVEVSHEAFSKLQAKKRRM